MLLLLLACFGDGKKDAEPKKDAPPAEKPAPKAPEKPAGAEYADQFLLILSSSLKKGEEPPGLPVVRTKTDLGLEPARLDSTAFKGLMPCYEVVIAGARKDRAEALALSEKLRAAGVDHYVKNAGAWVGPRPELDAYCRSLGSPASGSAGEAVFEPGLGALLSIEEAVARPILDGAPPVAKVSADGSLWAADLPHQTIGPWSVGQKVAGLGRGAAPQVCAIEGFRVGVAGQPHFGWAEQEGGPPSTPGCGEKALYAKVSCPEGDPLLVLASGRKGAVAAPLENQGKKTVRDPRASWMTNPPAAFAAEKKAVSDAAKASGRKIATKWTFDEHTLGGSTFAVVRVELKTGEGQWMCGGPDLFSAVVGVLDVSGKEVVPIAAAPTEDVRGLFDTDDDGVPELFLVDTLTGSARLLGAAGQTAWTRAYCDCAC